MGERVFIVETTGAGAGSEDFHTITVHKDGNGLLIQTHWHKVVQTDLSENTGLTDITMGFTVMPEGLVALRDAIDRHLSAIGQGITHQEGG